jgi:hypothetical protein
MQQHFDRLVQSVASSLGQEVQADAGETRILFDFEDFPMLVEYMPESEKVLLAVPIADLPPDGREALFLNLLQGNYLFHRTMGATLGVDVDSEFINLQIATDISVLTNENFPILMENFLSMAETWRNEVANLDAVPETAGEATNSGEAGQSPSHLLANDIRLAMIRG